MTTSNLLYLIFYYSAMFGIDPALTTAVIKTESNFKTHVIGSMGEVGLMQLRPRYFKEVHKNQLFDAETNIKLGVEHLALSRDRCKHQENNTWVVCYNLGIAGGNKIKHPKKFKYYQKVMENYNAFSDPTFVVR